MQRRHERGHAVRDSLFCGWKARIEHLARCKYAPFSSLESGQTLYAHCWRAVVKGSYYDGNAVDILPLLFSLQREIPKKVTTGL
jgi:hypothetical protein